MKTVTNRQYLFNKFITINLFYSPFADNKETIKNKSISVGKEIFDSTELHMYKEVIHIESWRLIND